jgi:hypothetical protein
MAIKISGTEVIDNSRNICNVNNLNATTINAPASGAFICQYAYTAINEGQLVSTDSDGAAAFVGDPFLCTYQSQSAGEESWCSDPRVQEIILNFPCSVCNGCYVKMQLLDGYCCRLDCLCFCNFSCGAIDAFMCYWFGCMSPGLGNSETFQCKCCYSTCICTTCTCCYVSQCVNFSFPAIVCDPNGSLVTVVVNQDCHGPMCCCDSLREFVFCYCTTTCQVSLVRECKASYCSYNYSAGNTSDLGNGIGALWVTPDNCYLIGIYGNYNCCTTCNCFKHGVMVKRVGCDCYIEATRATVAGCDAFCAIADTSLYGGVGFRVGENSGRNSWGLSPFTYGCDGWMIHHVQPFCVCQTERCTTLFQRMFAFKPLGCNCVCATRVLCPCAAGGDSRMHWINVGNQDTQSYTSGAVISGCCMYHQGYFFEGTRQYDQGDGIKKVIVHHYCVDSNENYSRFWNQRMFCFCVDTAVSPPCLCYKCSSDILDVLCCCSCSSVCYIGTNLHSGNQNLLFRQCPMKYCALSCWDWYLYAMSKPVCWQQSIYKTAGHPLHATGLMLNKGCCQQYNFCTKSFECCFACMCTVLGCCRDLMNAPLVYEYRLCNCATWCLNDDVCGQTAFYRATSTLVPFTLGGNLICSGVCHTSTCGTSPFTHFICVHSGCAYVASSRKFCEAFGDSCYNSLNNFKGNRRCFPFHLFTFECRGCGGSANYNCFLGIAQNTVAIGETVCVAVPGQIDRSSFSCTYFTNLVCTSVSGNFCYNKLCIRCCFSPLLQLYLGSNCICGFSSTSFCNYQATIHFRPFYDCNTGRVVSYIHATGNQ